MKILVTFVSFLWMTALTAQSIDKISFKTKKDFAESCENGKFCSTFSVGENPDQKAIENYIGYITVNNSIMSSVQNADQIKLTLNADKSERVVYQKIFYKLGVFQIEILEGEAKGIYYVDDFLNLFNL